MFVVEKCILEQQKTNKKQIRRLISTKISPKKNFNKQKSLRRSRVQSPGDQVNHLMILWQQRDR